MSLYNSKYLIPISAARGRAQRGAMQQRGGRQGWQPQQRTNTGGGGGRN